jgi:outer membrane receptor for ferric coprogen and ferric-rhodotorulic acid
MSGTGNPSAYVNMVRKHADSKEFKGSVSATYGSWNNQRYVLIPGSVNRVGQRPGTGHHRLPG